MHRYALLIVLLLFLSGPAWAQLEFDNRRAQPEAAPGVAVIESAFAFENAGEAGLTITDIDSSCGCTAAVIVLNSDDATAASESSGGDVRVIPAGARGEVRVTFSVGDRVGEQSKRIVISTDHPEQPRVRLTMTTVIPEVIRAEPGLLLWRDGQARAAQVATLTLLEDDRVSWLGLEPVEEDTLTVELREHEDGTRALTVTPLPGLAEGVYAVHARIAIDGQDEPRLYPIYARLIGDAPESPTTPEAPATPEPDLEAEAANVSVDE